MKIWYQSAVNFEDHPNYMAALNRHAKRVQSPGTETVFHGRSLDFGSELLMPDIINSPIVYHSVVMPQFISSLLEAERSGCDAFVIGSYSEPLLPELRSLAKIPIVSISECTFFTACTVAQKVGIVTLSKLVVPYIEKSLEHHRLEDRITGIHLVDEDMAEDALDQQFAAPGPYLDRVRAAARVAIAAGAQTVIPAEGLLAVIASENGLTEVDGAPIIDAVGTSILSAEFAVALKQRTGVAQSRLAFPPPTEAAAKVVRDGLSR